MKMDDTMKSLGVKFDMHFDNQVQLRECIDTVKEKGEKISIADGRRRDKMAGGRDLLPNQHCIQKSALPVASGGVREIGLSLRWAGKKNSLTYKRLFDKTNIR